MPVSKDHYYRLASNLSKERIQAATALIQELSNENSESDFNYALQRLITGLASNHDSARIGFSMCLTELISLLSENPSFNYKAETFLTDLESNLNKSIKNKTKGKNLRAYLFGKIFGIQSLINSTLLKDSPQDLILKIIDELFEVALTKSWIREISIVTIVKLIAKLNLSNDEKIIPYILSKLSESNLLLSMDGLLVYLSIPSNLRQPLSNLANLSNSQHWKNDDPLTKGNLPLLKDTFQDRVASDCNDDDSSAVQKGSWNPQLHYVWTLLLNELIENELANESLQGQHKSKKRKVNNSKSSSEYNKLSLSTFWPTFDATFFSNNSSSERKHTGLQILQLCFKFPSFKPEFFLILFNENLTRCLINHISKKDRMLNSLSNEVLSSATTLTKHSQSGRLFLIKSLEKQCILFDKITKTKTIKDCLSLILPNNDESDDNLIGAIENWIQLCLWILNKSDIELLDKKNNGSAKSDILSFKLDSLFTLIRGNKKLIRLVLNSETIENAILLEFISTIKNILEYLTHLNYIKQTEPTNEMTLKVSKDRLNSILADLMECSKGKIDWSGIIVEYLNENSNNLLFPIDEGGDDELKQVKGEAVKIWKKLGKQIKSGDLKDMKLRISKCILMLLSTALLELFDGDSESFGILSDVLNIYNDFINNSAQDDNDNILNTFIDLMLSYTTQKSGLKKRIGNDIWDSVVYDVSDEQLERLFDVLLTKENKLGMEQLFNQSVEGYEEDEESDKDDSHNNYQNEDHTDKNIEEYNGDNYIDDEDDDEDDEDDDEDDGDDGDDDNEAADDRDKIEEVEKCTTSALAKALNVAESSENSRNEVAADDDDDDDDIDDGEDGDDSYESDESMSDEQMMAIDSQLSAIFQQRQNSLNELRGSSKNGNERKLEAKDARELMSLCKLRILDLLEFYVNINSKKSECLSISIILLELMSLTIDLKVGEKAHKLIKKISKNTFEVKDDEELEKSINLITTILNHAATAKFNALSQACSQVSIYIIRSIVNSDTERYEEFITKVTKLYQTHLIKWSINSNDKTTPSVFIDLINWLNSKRSSLKKD